MPRRIDPQPLPLPEPEPVPMPDPVVMAPRWRLALDTGWAPPITDLINMTPLGQRVAVVNAPSIGASLPGLEEIDNITICRRVDGNPVFRDWYRKTTAEEPRAPRQGRRVTAPAAGQVERYDVSLRFSDDRPGGAAFVIRLQEAWAHDWQISFELDGSGAVQAVETLGITMTGWVRLD